jgi:phosphoglucomutase
LVSIDTFASGVDAPATAEQRAKLQRLSAAAIKESDLTGEPITARLTELRATMPRSAA